jgi:hypothetical protein
MRADGGGLDQGRRPGGHHIVGMIEGSGPHLGLHIARQGAQGGAAGLLPFGGVDPALEGPVAGEAELAAGLVLEGLGRIALVDHAANRFGEARVAGAVERHLDHGGLGVRPGVAGLEIGDLGQALQGLGALRGPHVQDERLGDALRGGDGHLGIDLARLSPGQAVQIEMRPQARLAQQVLKDMPAIDPRGCPRLGQGQVDPPVQGGTISGVRRFRGRMDHGIGQGQAGHGAQDEQHPKAGDGVQAYRDLRKSHTQMRPARRNAVGFTVHMGHKGFGVLRCRPRRPRPADPPGSTCAAQLTGAASCRYPQEASARCRPNVAQMWRGLRTRPFVAAGLAKPS